MKKFVKSSFWSDPLKVGCIPHRNLIDKHFQQFLLINQIMSNNYEKKRYRSGELSQSGLKVIVLQLGNVHTYIREKDIMTSLIVFILSSIFQKKTVSSLQSILNSTVFLYQIQEMTVNSVFHNVVLVQGAPCSSPNFVFRRKLRNDFIFGMPYLDFFTCNELFLRHSFIFGVFLSILTAFSRKQWMGSPQFRATGIFYGQKPYKLRIFLSVTVNFSSIFD